MRESSTPKWKLTTTIFHVNSFVVLFSFIFLLMWQLKILIQCFLWNQFDETKHVQFLNNASNKNVSNCVVYIIKFIWYNPGNTVLYPGVSLGTPVLSPTRQQDVVATSQRRLPVHLNDVAVASQMKHPTTSPWNVAKASQWYVSTTSYWNVVTTSQKDVTTMSHQCVSSTSQTSLKWNTQRRLSGTSPRRLSGTYPRRPISTSLWRLL